jgi:hypothetical protein
MTTEERCDCCDLPVTSCGKAVEQANERASRVAILASWPGRSVTALWPGTCPSCGEAYEEGDTITRCLDTGWVCEGCTP